MKKIKLLLASLVLAAFAFQGCEDMDDNAVPVNDFIWKGLNLYYLWQENVPNLADDRFANQEQLNTFLEGYSGPESLFESLLYRKYPDGTNADRFSVIFSDFNVLENTLQGVSTSNGVDFALVYADQSKTNIFGYVRYILPDTDAATKNIKRGDIFYAVNGTQLTVSNYQQLLGQSSYTLSLGTYTDGAVVPTGVDVTLAKTQYAENPVYSVKVVESGSNKIGYLMYNGFYNTYDADLNNAFAELSSAGVTDLVLDLRYNGGGSVSTATYLASMITGQFNGQLFAKQQWNSKLQAYYEDRNPAALTNLFSDKLGNGFTINHLNLSRVYIITTEATASASELVINCLKPYISVIQIGETTVGKNVGSVTLYDSPTFSKKDVNGSHRYAMQPIVIRTVNKEGFGEYSSGIVPTIEHKEDISNMGIIGDAAEPLFAEAIANITGTGGRTSGRWGTINKPRGFKDTRTMKRFGTEMYINEMPEGSLDLVKLLQ
ncbi:S41 family peptidase [Flavobacterium sp. DG1-102-2]|uniref:S41 family peptidase n=1 Tax=Flavobacterium sp. DG1-102-2 TaxID=3081663 RepID=UPI0029492F64|nr:S41 family peptidase [Flavobacterium sp. DG1-102-2]MDV6168020.1 S41 family peptidase [Flavobacterium sp. DG1-102-2]